MVTIKDIAAEAGVAPSTVSYALNNDSRIPEETKNKVLDAARKLGYEGRSGKKGSSVYKRHIILCLNSINGIIYSELSIALKEVLKPSNCEILIYLGSSVTDIRQSDGMIVLNSRVTNESIRELVKRKLPIVIMDRNENLNGTVAVTLDNAGGCYSVTKYALEQGAKSFCFVGGPVSSFESMQRFEGFKQAVRENGDYPYTQINGDFTRESGVRVAKYLLNAPLPEAIICANDEMAAGISDYLFKQGYKLPQDVLVGGFDGNGCEMHKGYFTACANRWDWGHSVAYTLLNCLDGSTPLKDVVIPAKLMIYK